jgi:HEAT repeat protein
MSRTVLSWSIGPLCLVFVVMASGCSKPQPAPPSAAVTPAAPTETKAAAPAQAPAAGDTAKGTTADKAAADAAPSLAELRKTLTTTDDSRIRVITIDEIAKLGQNARPALDDLVKATSDPELRVRWHAARAIGMIGEDAISALPTLLGLLGDSDPIVATQAAAAIGLVRDDDERATLPEKDAAAYAAARQALLKTLEHPDGRVRRAGLRSLRSLDPDPKKLAPLLCSQLDDADPAVIMPALQTLATMEAEAVPVLVEALADPKARYWAAVGLTEIGADAKAAAEPLAKLLADGEFNERLQACLALAAIGESAKTAVPALVKVLDSGEDLLQYTAAFALGKIRDSAADQSLQRAADDADSYLGEIAAWARAQIHPDDKALVAEAVKRLRAGLQSDKSNVRSASISGLSDMAEMLDDAGRESLAKDFVGLLRDADQSVDRSAGAALIRLGKPAVDVLRATLASPELRLAALEILGEIGPPAKAAVADVIAVLADANPEFRSDAAMTLGRMGDAAAEAVPQLLKMLEGSGSEPSDRYAAAFALGRAGAAAKAALPKLRDISQGQDELLATVAAWAALKIDPNDAAMVETAIPLLRRAARADREPVRLEAAISLGEIGPAAATAIPILELVSEDDPSRSVRQAAKEAVRKISGK